MKTDPAEPDRLSESDVAESVDVHYRVLSVKAIWWAAGLIVLVGVAVAVWLLLAYGHGGEQARNQLEAIKTAGTIVVGAGGAAALLLAARRQRTAEIALRQKDRDQAAVGRAHALQERVAAETKAHQERVAAAAELDAVERRVTELYTKAVDQLGSDKAPVRLAGLYALERVGQNNPDQRQTIVNVLCAYLRMPYQPPGAPPDKDAEQTLVLAHQERVQEREVRLTAQRLLRVHLMPRRPTFWEDVDLDLTDATLIDFTLANCVMRTATFSEAQFIGAARFYEAQFTGVAVFDGAQFAGFAGFDRAQFAGVAEFGDAEFTGTASFTESQFADVAWFGGARFAGIAEFDEARFAGAAKFDEARFIGAAKFTRAQFTGVAEFDGAAFDAARFDEVRFTGAARFDDAVFTRTATFTKAQFDGATTFTKAHFDGVVPPEVTVFLSSGEEAGAPAAVGVSGSGGPDAADGVGPASRPVRKPDTNPQ